MLLKSTATTRLTAMVVTGSLGWALAWPLDSSRRILLAWSVSAITYLALAWSLAVVCNAHRTRMRSSAEDQSGVVIFLILILAFIASITAVVGLLHQASTLPAAQRGAHIALALVALACSWLLIHTIFAFRYAHRYYQAGPGDTPAGYGLQFPHDKTPDYLDFLYHAYVIGMTSQVADVSVTSREMRALTLGHSLLSFAFNMLVLALSVNVVAGII